MPASSANVVCSLACRRSPGHAACVWRVFQARPLTSCHFSIVRKDTARRCAVACCTTGRTEICTVTENFGL